MSTKLPQKRGVFNYLRRKFRERWVIGHDYEDYLTSGKYDHAAARARLPGEKHEYNTWRFPSPASRPEANIPRHVPEYVYDIHKWKRGSIKVKPTLPANAFIGTNKDKELTTVNNIPEFKSEFPLGAEYDPENPHTRRNKHGMPLGMSQFIINGVPQHLPMPFWLKSPEAMKHLRKEYIESDGWMPIGVYYKPTPEEFIDVSFKPY